MSLYNIAVIFPSRGMVFTDTFKELLDELTDSKALYTIYWSHGNKLPACFNKPLQRALKANHSHIWFVEDDMVLKKGILKELLKANKDIIACDYPLVKFASGTVLYDKEDNAIFTGTGCMLVKKHVLDDMPKPIFRADIRWGFKQFHDKKVKFTAENVDPDKVYGHHDITFGLYQYVNNQPISVYKTPLSQRKLKKRGENGNNIGTDTIELFEDYRKINYWMIEAEPEVVDNLTTVYIDKKAVWVSKELAKKIGKYIGPDMIETKNVILDFNNNKIARKALKGTK